MFFVLLVLIVVGGMWLIGKLQQSNRSDKDQMSDGVLGSMLIGIVSVLFFWMREDA